MAMSAKPRPPVRLDPPAERFRREIEAAGADRSDMVLKLTRGDGAKLKRDRNLPVSDISFANGEMRFLGVLVTEGDTPDSVLVIGEG